jgi:hypothetical protein
MALTEVKSSKLIEKYNFDTDHHHHLLVFNQQQPPTHVLFTMSDSIKVEEKPKLEDITMEDATETAPSTVSAVEEFAPQKNADGELIIKDLPEVLRGKDEKEVAEVKKSIVEQGKSTLRFHSGFFSRGEKGRV